MYYDTSLSFPLVSFLKKRPDAVALIKGSKEYPHIEGLVRFYKTNPGIIVYAKINGLPEGENSCQDRIFGFHIHEGETCTGDMNDPFSDAMTHYNPKNCPHPHHAGDLPPLFGNNGFAVSVFLTNRFTLDEITGKTVIIHDNADDFTSQPSGNSGTKIACGVIKI